jgi:hypothetical protein
MSSNNPPKITLKPITPSVMPKNWSLSPSAFYTVAPKPAPTPSVSSLTNAFGKAKI